LETWILIAISLVLFVFIEDFPYICKQTIILANQNILHIMKQFEKIKAVILDYCGTIDTNARHWFYVLWEAYRHVGMPINEEQFKSAYIFGEHALAKAPIVKPGDDFRALLLKKIEQEIAWLEFSKQVKISGLEHQSYLYDIANYCNNYVLRTLEKTGRPVLETLKAKYPLVLVANFYGNMKTVLREYDIDVFKAIVESSVVGAKKPNPRIFEIGVEKTGFQPEEILVIGDHFKKDIVPAHSIGCSTIWLRGEGWKDEENPDESLADAIISDFAELKNLL